MWKLTPLEIDDRKNDMASNLNHDFRINRFAETGEMLCVCNYEPVVDDQMWYNKLLDDQCNDMKNEKEIRDIIMRSPSLEEKSIFSNANFDLTTLDIDDVGKILEQMEEEATEIPKLKINPKKRKDYHCTRPKTQTI